MPLACFVLLSMISVRVKAMAECEPVDELYFVGNKKTNITEFVEAVVSYGQPVLIRNLATGLNWQAFSLWRNQSYLVEALGGDLTIKKQLNDSTFTLHNPKFPFHPTPSKKYSLEKISTNSFVSNVFDEVNTVDGTQSYYYFSGELPESMEDDVKNEPLKVKHVDKSKSHSVLWVGSEGVKAQLHYDISYNFFTQIVGNKTFTLYNPANYRYLKLYPSIHPARRQSQVQNYSTLNVSSITANLGEGDVLYVPPFWLHTVHSSSKHSISISTVSASKIEYFWSFVDKQQIALHKLKPGIQRILGVRIYVEALMHSLSINTKEFMALLWDTRYSRIYDYLDNTVASNLLDVDEIIGESQSVHYKRFNCNDFALLKKVALVLSDVNDKTSEMLGSIVQSISKQIVDLKSDNVLHDGILDMLLQDYVEKLLQHAVGKENTIDIAVAINECFL